jgi:ribose transport system permease protein
MRLRSGRIQYLEMAQRSALILAWGVIVLIFSVLQPSDFPTTENFASIFGSQAYIGFLALGLIIVLRVGEFDLSVAATMTVGSVMFAKLDVEHGFPILVSILITLLIGSGIGIANGVLVVRFGVDSFIATLGVATILQGAALWLTDQKTIVGVSETLTRLVVVDRFLGISLEFYYSLGLMALLAYLFRYTVFGRRLLFVGKNKEVARLSGIDVSRLKMGAFVLTGTIGAGAGVLLTGTGGSASPDAGLVFLLPVYAAAFLGATTTKTGEFTPIGTMVAIYLLATGVQGLAIQGVAIYVQQIFYGGALIVAVVGSKVLITRGAARRTRPVDTGTGAGLPEAEVV